MTKEEKAMEVWRLAKYSPGPIPLLKAARELGYATTHGVAKRIDAAQKWFKEKKPVEAAEIARSFVDQNGHWPWWKKEGKKS